MTVFIRQPTWVLGPFGAPPRSYSAVELQGFAQQPEKLLEKRKQFENRVNSYFGICLKDSPQQAALRRRLTQKILDQLAETKYADSAEAEAGFVPQYAVGCRRPTPGVGYIESLAADNVTLVVGAIGRATADGIVDQSGRSHPLDALICATGFDTSHRPSFPILGRDGSDLRELWAREATAYLALAVPHFPNYFVFYGPNNPFASGPFLATVGKHYFAFGLFDAQPAASGSRMHGALRIKRFSLTNAPTEAQADYMLKWCDRWQTENIHSFSPKQEAVDEFDAYAKGLIQTTVWADHCGSWYKASPSDPAKASLWPGSGLHYVEAISSLRGDDFDVRYRGNRWNWLGNGFSQVEVDQECDLSYYIRQQDDSEFLSSKRRRREIAKGSQVDRATLHVM